MALATFTTTRAGKSTSTKKAKERMIPECGKTFPLAMTEPCHKIRHSHLAKWLADVAQLTPTRKRKGRTINRWRLFLRQLCGTMETENMLPKSPFLDKKHKLAKPDRVIRKIPTVPLRACFPSPHAFV